MIKKNSRKASEEPKKTRQERYADDLVNVKDINNCFLYTKDNYIIGFLRLGSVNIDLLSREELDSLTQKLTMSFESDKRNFDYFSLPSEVNLDKNKEFLKRKHQETDNLGRRKLLALQLARMTELSTSGENFEHQHYIKLWVKTGSNIKDSQHELLVRLNEFKDRFTEAGISTEILKDNEIIKMCNLFANPREAPFSVRTAKYMETAIIRG